MPARTGCCKYKFNIEKIDAATGASIWRRRIPLRPTSYPFDDDGSELRALSDGTLVFITNVTGGNSILRHISGDALAEIWNVPLDAPYPNLGHSGIVAVGGDDTIYVMGLNAVTAYYPPDGTIIWRVHPFSNPSAVGQIVYFNDGLTATLSAWDGSNLVILDPANGSTISGPSGGYVPGNGILADVNSEGRVWLLPPLFGPPTVFFRDIPGTTTWEFSFGVQVCFGPPHHTYAAFPDFGLPQPGPPAFAKACDVKDFDTTKTQLIAGFERWEGTPAAQAPNELDLGVNNLTQAPPSDIVTAGTKGWMPVVDGTTGPDFEYKNVWRFDSLGNLVWTHKQEIDVHTDYCVKQGLAIAADGNVIVTNQLFDVPKGAPR